ncbi:MAG: type IV secretion system DNA-binding domain-containing protein [Anaerolineaceae bacterium]|nr:type IV secretion system DNA-binding domain-containing protein [Anaerolineaceae bacterium]
MAKSKKSAFYLGRIFDPKSGEITDEDLLYKSSHLTTHAMVTGMTGSGKTGMCAGLLEEAALQGIPAIVIDPKGDLTNLLLHFPDLLPGDFEPWLDPDEARRKGKDMGALAVDKAALWKNGLADWGLGHDDLLALKSAAEFAVYTPGSTSGLPVNILSSFALPELEWEENAEVLRERISSTVTGLLALIGMNDIDPLRSREHILLSNLLEEAWSNGQSLDLMQLIMQVQQPPMDRLGAFPLESFFPEKERFDLAMLLNNFLASPSFQSWLEGQSLDVEQLLYAEDGRPRHSIFYLAHLSEAERMFFVTLLFSAIETWMRAQRGTSGLRALVYFDEIMGYLPPVANPPSRTIMLRMLKQARAFGVGMLLATQNPVDLDYKALSNIGTWIIGRLQTERDKDRLMDGLQSAGGDIDLKTIDKMISGLKKRVFLMHNVHSGSPKLFSTRWVMNYLAGPLTRTQIPALNTLVHAELHEEKAAKATAAKSTRTSKTAATPKKEVAATTGVRPVLSTGLEEYFLPSTLDVRAAVQAARLNLDGAPQVEGLLYRPALLAQAEVRYYSQKYDVEHEQRIASLVQEMGGRAIRWEDHPWQAQDARDMHRQPQPNASFDMLPGWLSKAKGVKSLESDFVDWVYRNGAIRVRANTALKMYAGPEVSSAEFREMCSKAAREKLETEEDKLETSYDKKLDAMEAKIRRQELEVEDAEDEIGQRRMEELGTHGELLISMLTSKRRRSVSSSLTKRRMTQQAKDDFEQETEELTALKLRLDALEEEQNDAVQKAKDHWADVAKDISEVPLNPYKKDIFVEMFGVAWLPYYQIKDGSRVREVPAFSQK